MTIEERKQMIQNKIRATAQSKAKALDENKIRLNKALCKLETLSKDVIELIELANYCKAQGIEFPYVNILESHTKMFIADITNNTFGFIKASVEGFPIIGIGIYKNNIEIYYDGENLKAYNCYKFTEVTNIPANLVEDMCADIPHFKKEFYEWFNEEFNCAQE